MEDRVTKSVDRQGTLMDPSKTLYVHGPDVETCKSTLSRVHPGPVTIKNFRGDLLYECTLVPTLGDERVQGRGIIGDT